MAVVFLKAPGEKKKDLTFSSTHSYFSHFSSCISCSILLFPWAAFAVSPSADLTFISIALGSGSGRAAPSSSSPSRFDRDCALFLVDTSSIASRWCSCGRSCTTDDKGARWSSSVSAELASYLFRSRNKEGNSKSIKEEQGDTHYF